MCEYIYQRLIRSAISVIRTLAIAAVLLLTTNVAPAADQRDVPPPAPRGAEIRSGGVVEESFVYHRQPPQATPAARSIEPAGGWYGYGFPVSTFRWGWFGAAHYYPTVFWHEGYYGECCRYGYRHGY